MKRNKDGSNILDGTATHADSLTPFNAHEQATRGTHVPTAIDGPDLSAGEQYPKAVDHVEIDGHLEPVIANDAKHEKQLAADKKEA